MRKVSSVLLWLYVFTVPWDVVAVSGIGTLTRVVGFLAIGAVALSVIAEGRFRRPDIVVTMATVFTVLSGLSLLWTKSYSATSEAVWSYVQLLGSVWAVRQGGQTSRQREQLMVAFCLGVFVPMFDLLWHFSIGSSLPGGGRYTATRQNADTVATLLVVGIPIAWRLTMTSRGASRAIAATYLAIAPLEVILTGVRGAFLALPIALSVVRLTSREASRRWVPRAALCLVVIAASAAPLVPQSTWARLATIPAEILGGGTLSSRREIWGAGLAVVPEHPVWGVGAGTYGLVLEEAGYHANPAHNLFVGLLVEQGIVGLIAFSLIFGGCGVTVAHMASFDRKIWGALLISFAVILMSQSLERWKVTWLLFGLLAAHNEARAMSSYALRIPVRSRVDLVQRG